MRPLPGRALAWLALACLAILAAAAGAWAAEGPPADADVVGTYRFTYTVTNAKGATKWVYRVRRRCKAPCLRFSIIPRLTTAKQAVSRTSVYTWRDGGYERDKTILATTDCIGRGKKTIARGYDIVSHERVRVMRTGGGRVLAFRGEGRDDYRPNARGRRGGCRRGAYLFDVTGVALPRARLTRPIAVR